MYNAVYFQPEYPCVVAEYCSRVDRYRADPQSVEWTEDRLAAIRTVLHGLSAARVMNPNDAEDLVQDTLLTALTKYPENELRKGLLVWSMGILRKKLGNYYRKTQRFTCFSEKGPGSRKPLRELHTSASPEADFFREELQTIINQTLERFPLSQRQAIELLAAGFNSGEVVEQLQPERYQNVINNIFRGRQRLAKELAKYGYSPGTMTGKRSMQKCRSKR